MLKKLDEFNRKISKVLVIINIFMVLLDFVGIFVAEEYDQKISFLKYMALHTVTLVFLLMVSKKQKNE